MTQQNYLWTPWRMEYIAGATGSAGGNQPAEKEAAQEADLPQVESTGCVFCDRIRMSAEHDRANLDPAAWRA